MSIIVYSVHLGSQLGIKMIVLGNGVFQQCKVIGHYLSGVHVFHVLDPAFFFTSPDPISFAIILFLLVSFSDPEIRFDLS